MFPFAISFKNSSHIFFAAAFKGYLPISQSDNENTLGGKSLHEVTNLSVSVSVIVFYHHALISNVGKKLCLST